MGEGVEDLGRDPGEVAALHSGVVLHADSGEQSDLLTTKTRDAALPAAGESDALGSDTVPS